MFRKYDAGADQTTRHDRADCTVRALSVATGMQYEDAWIVFYRLQAPFRSLTWWGGEPLGQAPLVIRKGEILLTMLFSL